MARVPYLSEEELPEKYRYLFSPANPFSVDRNATTEDEEDAPWDGPQHTHRAIANNPELLEAYRRMGSSVWHASGLSDRERELTILTVARTLESAYEWFQHVRIALDAGVSREDILAVSHREYDPLSPSDRALVRYVAAFTDRTVDDETHAKLAEHFDEATIVGIGMLASYYIGIDYMGDAFDLEMEDEFVGWELENI
jgi:alkylhydroperoxidase family enzyme